MPTPRRFRLLSRTTLLFLIVASATCALAARLTLFRPNLTPAEQGRRIAERSGCFACHGPEGTQGVANPGRTGRTVPTYLGELMMYAKNEQEIREWIRDGGTAQRLGSQTWHEERDRGVLKMPAFRDRLSDRQIKDLVAFVMARTGEPTPSDLLAQRGLERAEDLGCVGCHGAGGQFARQNPGSLKGYVPPWDGADFPELVRNREEFGEWVERGVSRRFEKNPLAQFFLKRAILRMPAYRDHAKPGDVDALWAYVRWLRAQDTNAR